MCGGKIGVGVNSRINYLNLFCSLSFSLSELLLLLLSSVPSSMWFAWVLHGSLLLLLSVSLVLSKRQQEEKRINIECVWLCAHCSCLFCWASQFISLWNNHYNSIHGLTTVNSMDHFMSYTFFPVVSTLIFLFIFSRCYLLFLAHTHSLTRTSSFLLWQEEEIR